jgi:DNA polymerase-3 subunit beta
MELTIKKEDLVKGLGKSQPVVEKKTSMPILSNVLMKAQGDEIFFRATDLETSFEGRYPAKVSKEGSITVPANKLFEIVKELPSEDVYLKEKDNSFLHVTGGRAKFELVGLPAEDFPSLPEVEDIPELQIQGEILDEMLEKTRFAISQEETRFNLAGLYVEKREGDNGPILRMVSTDGHRLSLIDKELPGLESFSLEKGVIIPRKGVNEMKKLAVEGGDLILGLNQNFAVVKKAEVSLVLRLQDGTFPDYEVVIPKSTKLSAGVNRQSFYNVLKRVSILASDRFQGIRMEFKEGLLEVISQNPDLGNAREALELDYDGSEFDVGFNANYFKELSSAMRSENIALNFVDEQNPCVITGEGDPGFISVIMPMRL